MEFKPHIIREIYFRVLSRRPSHVPIVTSNEEVHLDPDVAPIANVIKQRRASIYTVTSDQYQLDLQRRMSRLSRQSSGRSDYAGPTLTVPVISNVLDAEVSAVTTAEVVENSRNLNVLQTPTFQVINRYDYINNTLNLKINFLPYYVFLSALKFLS